MASSRLVLSAHLSTAGRFGGAAPPVSTRAPNDRSVEPSSMRAKCSSRWAVIEKAQRDPARHEVVFARNSDCPGHSFAHDPIGGRSVAEIDQPAKPTRDARATLITLLSPTSLTLGTRRSAEPVDSHENGALMRHRCGSLHMLHSLTSARRRSIECSASRICTDEGRVTLESSLAFCVTQQRPFNELLRHWIAERCHKRGRFARFMQPHQLECFASPRRDRR